MEQRRFNTHIAAKSARGRLLLYGLLLAAAVAMMVMLKRCSTPSPFAPVEIGHSEGDTIDVAIEYSPMTFYRYDDTLGGLAYDMLRTIGAQAGIPLKFHPVTSGANALGLLADEAVDVVVADVPRTADYDSTQVVFTEPVYLDRQVLVQRTDSAGGVAVSSALDLAGRRVTVASNSPMLHRLKNLSAEIGDTIIIEVDSIHGPEQLVIMTALGETEMTVVNSRLAERVAEHYASQLDAGMRISFTQFQSWMLRSDNEPLRERLDTLIFNFKQTPAYDALLKRYGL